MEITKKILKKFINLYTKKIVYARVNIILTSFPWFEKIILNFKNKLFYTS